MKKFLICKKIYIENYFFRFYSEDSHIENYNKAIILFLDYIKELTEYLKENKFIIPENYPFYIMIEDDKINNYSIIYDEDNYEIWSKGMKYLMIILKSFIDLALQKQNKFYENILKNSSLVMN